MSQLEKHTCDLNHDKKKTLKKEIHSGALT